MHVFSTQFNPEVSNPTICSYYCIKPFDENDLVFTKCSHVFHRDCKDALVAMAQWSQKCPSCKQADPWDKGAIIKPMVDGPALHRAIDKIGAWNVHKFLNACEEIKNNVDQAKNRDKIQELVFSGQSANVNDWCELSKSMAVHDGVWSSLNALIRHWVRTQNIEADIFKNSKGRAIQSADELPKYCSELAAQIDSFEPQFKSHQRPGQSYKLMELNGDKDVVTICDIFNENVFKILGKKSPILTYRLYTMKNRIFEDLEPLSSTAIYDRLWNGLMMYSPGEEETCSVKEVEAAYKEILQKMQTGWVEASIVDHKDILMKKDPDQFLLYIKKDQFLSQEVFLINSILRKLSLLGKVECDNLYYSPGHVSICGGPSYLWIEQTAFSEVIETLGIKRSSDS
jgi:hypothetical protein